MSLDVVINLNSLKLVKDELDNTIAHAGTELEAYLASPDDPTHAEQSLASLAQVAGTFKLIEFPGAAVLAEEMSLTLKAVLNKDIKSSDTVLAAITRNLFVLPRYIEYVGIRQLALPSLLIPYINELRITRKQALLPEYHFAGFNASEGAFSNDGEPQLAELIASIGRMRHMYQIGFLGLITEKKPSPYFAQLIQRSVTRVNNMLTGHPGREIWYLASVFTTCIASSSLEMTLNRKRLLANIEGLFRQLISKGADALNQQHDSLKKDLLYLIAVSDCQEDTVVRVKQDYNLPTFSLSLNEMAVEREKMYGPSIDTMDSVVKVIKEELRHTKDILEIASQNNSIQSDDHQTLMDIVQRIADTLGILNLSGPMSLLRNEMEFIAGWITQGDEVSAATFNSTADTLLFVEGALSGLQRREVTVDELNTATEETRKKIIAQSHLADAQRVVLEEAQAGIALSKRAISSYVESNFDSGHIANLEVTLNTVRGGLLVLNHERAASILKNCGQFIEGHIHDKNASTHRHQLLETLADALISMEYYLGEVATGHKVNEKILDIAEESLTALGFGVNENH